MDEWNLKKLQNENSYTTLNNSVLVNEYIDESFDFSFNSVPEKSTVIVNYNEETNKYGKPSTAHHFVRLQDNDENSG